MRSLIVTLAFFACAAGAEPEVVKPSGPCGPKATPRYRLHFVNVELKYLLTTLADSFCKPALIVDVPEGRVTFDSNDETVGADKARPILVKLFAERGFAVDEEPAQLRIHRAAKR